MATKRRALRISVSAQEVDYEAQDSRSVHSARALFPVGPQDSAVELEDFFGRVSADLSSYLLEREGQ